MVIETLEKEMNALKEVEEFLITGDNIPYCLSRTLEGSMPKIADNTYPEEDTNSGENRLREREWLRDERSNKYRNTWKE